MIELEQFSLVFLAEKQAITLKMLIISNDHISCFKFLYKIRVGTLSYHFNPVTNKAHTFPPQFTAKPAALLNYSLQNQPFRSHW